MGGLARHRRTERDVRGGHSVALPHEMANASSHLDTAIAIVGNGRMGRLVALLARRR